VIEYSYIVILVMWHGVMMWCGLVI